MATDHPIRIAVDTVDANSTESGITATLEEAIIKRTALVIGPSESLGDITQATGEKALAVIHGATGQVYFLDAGDTVSTDDGVLVLVDGSGNRYHLQDNATLNLSSVVSAGNTPAASPTVGECYRVGTAPTGAWAANANDIAAYTRRGWVFVTPNVGLTVLNEATGENEQFSAAGAWGAFMAAHSDGSLLPVSMEWPAGLAIEAEQDAPPGSPVADYYYIVGSSPTGAWSGKSGKLANYRDGAWVFIDPYEGARAYDRSTNYMVYFDGSAWGGQSVSSYEAFTASGTWSKPSYGTFALVRLWGGGGSGGKDNEGGGGGGGGGYNEHIFQLADLSATVAVGIGLGGAAKTVNGPGVAGGDTTFGAYLTAYGGGGGGVAPSGSQPGVGGGGGSAFGAGQGSINADSSAGGAGGLSAILVAAAGSATGGAPAAGTSSESGGGGGGGACTASSAGGAGGNSNLGGGGGGGGGMTSDGGAGGHSIKGGGGGGGSTDAATAGAGGSSVYGGNGGAGATDVANATAGAQPGGGGGGSETGNSGKGGDGMAEVLVF